MKEKTTIACKHLLIGAFSLICLSGFSQKADWVDGYVVYNTLDTIHGTHYDLKPGKSHNKIIFKNENGKRVKFKKKEVLAYQKNGDVYYTKTYEKPASFGNSLGFMRIIRDGKVKLYEYKYIVEISENNKTTYTDYYFEKDGELTRVKTNKFESVMAEYFSDNPALAEKIANEELVYGDLFKIADEYNAEN